MGQDPEIIALSNAYESLKKMNKAQVFRIITWISDKFGLSQNSIKNETIPVYAENLTDKHTSDINERKHSGQTENRKTEATYTHTIEFDDASEEIKKKRTRKKGESDTSTLEPKTPPHELKDFESTEELFKYVKPRKLSEKVLLILGYLRERYNFQETTSNEITTRLKKVEKNIKYISSTVNNLIRFKSNMITATKKNDVKQTRKKIMLTDEGLEYVKNIVSNSLK